MAFKLVVIGPCRCKMERAWRELIRALGSDRGTDAARCVAFDAAMTTLPFLRLEACFLLHRSPC